MSTLRTNTITDAAGSNSMPVADINQGRAKAWYNLNGTGTITARDTFNIGSFTDNGTGNYSATFSAALGNANWTALVAGGNVSAFAGGAIDQNDRSASATGSAMWWASTLTLTDISTAQLSVFGD